MQKLRIYHRLCIIAAIVLLVILAAFQAVWVAGGSGTSIMYQAGLQRGRAERIAKDALVLAYRPESEHAQALNELQNMLPVFEGGQQALQSGDRSLMLPMHPPESVLALLASSQPDYAAIDTAARQIAASPEHLDLLQVEIIVGHERGYFLTLSELNTAWMDYIDGAFMQIFWFEEAITVVTAALLVTEHLVVARRIYRYIKEKGDDHG